MWELAVPHLPSRMIDFKGLARSLFLYFHMQFLLERLLFSVI
jgi:hypothetical protein